MKFKSNDQPPKRTTYTPPEEPKRRGFKTYLKWIGIGFLVLLIIGGLYSCMGGGTDEEPTEPEAETDTVVTEEETEEPEQTEEEPAQAPSASTVNEAIEQGNEFIGRLDAISTDTAMSAEDKVAQINQIQQEIQPNFDALETSKDENAYQGGADYWAWQGYSGINSACSTLIQYVETGDPKDLEDFNKLSQATKDNFNDATEKLTK